MKNFLPNEFKFSHDLCFFIHDILLNTLVSGEQQNIFEYNFNIEEELLNKLSSDMDIFDFLENEKLDSNRSELLIRLILPNLLSDMLHCIYESLNCSKKAKLNISFMLIRKPIQESLYLLESMVLDKLTFGKDLATNPLNLRPSVTMKSNGIDGHSKRIEKILKILKIDNVFSSSYLSKLRYYKKSSDSFDGICNHAMHLFTEHHAIKTEKLNINFIFSNQKSRMTQWEYFYSRLPYILVYLYILIEKLVEDIELTEKWYLDEINLRISCHIILWWNNLDENYKTKEFEVLYKHYTSIAHKYFTIVNMEMNVENISKIANEGTIENR